MLKRCVDYKPWVEKGAWTATEGVYLLSGFEPPAEEPDYVAMSLQPPGSDERLVADRYLQAIEAIASGELPTTRRLD